MISTRDEQLALAQQQVFRSRQKYLRAKARLERDIKRRDELRPVARAHKAVKNIYDAVQTLTEQPAPKPTPTLDSDPRTPADQVHEFFTRPGDFYHVALALPAPTNGAKLGAGFIVKADDTQLPYLLEVLRQLRGALGEGTRVELTKAQITPSDGPPMEIGKDFTLGDRFPASPGVPIPRVDGVQLGTGALTPGTDRVRRVADQVAEVAEQHGVKPEQIQVIPVRGGGYAYTVKPEPQPERGRHARPDAAWDNSPAPRHLATDDDHDDQDAEDAWWAPCGRSGPCWKADGHEGDCTP
ncbi:Uncharacterised protein [Mycobacteroides abscessus subsp. abscessus]|nr:hypothetical protein [Mycobacteroides abscessus]MDO3245250.1 hypothetical protein [Mycobacteroides abscessus subsp. abscessus]MDO3327497.1 hypothetical protein [Mycobacteroides abscessus subsp. abscessus]MDO3347283.1 hypothetical protein [Mycobacteroides abscessus subsp. abscessus]SHT36996.1 Uncharacterised protein [Mycobacteroides abscessus subsp. abscessus]SHU45936.1 Uncharacterised protein [Mycobacteroides abscessus subsp. abscessus]